MLIALACISTLQSCYKDGTILATHFSFTAPTLVAPVDAATLHLSGTTVDLKWGSTNESGDAIKADVYFGTSDTPPLYKSNHNALILNVPVVQGQTYFWYVVMKDKNGIPTTSSTWSFTVFEPIGIFVGAYTVDEPAEGWTYPVNLSKVNATTLKIDQYWASWPSNFTLDFTANTYTMPLVDFGGGYSAIESGTIDPATGTLVGTYTIYHPAGVSIETGTHTYTKD